MAGKHNIIIEQGSSFDGLDLTIDSDGTPIDLTGYSFAGSIKSSFYSSAIMATFVVNIIDPINGVVSLTLPNSVTQTLSPGSAIYDVEMTDTTGKVTRLLEGRVTITPEITI